VNKSSNATPTPSPSKRRQPKQEIFERSTSSSAYGEDAIVGMHDNSVLSPFAYGQIDAMNFDMPGMGDGMMMQAHQFWQHGTDEL